MELILACTILSVWTVIVMTDKAKRKRNTIQALIGSIPAARPAAREGIHISLVTDNASKRTFRGLWIETPTGSTVIELTERRAVAWPSVN